MSHRALIVSPVYDQGDNLLRYDVDDLANQGEDGDPAGVASFVSRADAELFVLAEQLIDALVLASDYVKGESLEHAMVLREPWQGETLGRVLQSIRTRLNR